MQVDAHICMLIIFACLSYLQQTYYTFAKIFGYYLPLQVSYWYFDVAE